MGVVNTKSTPVTNADATPSKKTAALIAGGRLRSIVALVEIAAADSDLSVYRFARIKSHWRIVSIRKFHDAITSGTAYEFGLYDTAENGGLVVDADAYAQTVDISSADIIGAEIAYEKRDVSKINDQVWQDAGLSADSQKEYDLAALATTVGSAAGTLALVIQYVDGS